MPQIGLMLPTAAPDARPDTAVTFARAAEAAGLGSVWIIDRLVFDNMEPLLALAAVAATTTRVLLGTSVLLGTLRPPALLAKQVATLDVLSGGRVILGLGVGSRPDDFAAAGVPYAARGPRLAEAMRIMRQVWSGAPLAHEAAPTSSRPARSGRARFSGAGRRYGWAAARRPRCAAPAAWRTGTSAAPPADPRGYGRPPTPCARRRLPPGAIPARSRSPAWCGPRWTTTRHGPTNGPPPTCDTTTHPRGRASPRRRSSARRTSAVAAAKSISRRAPMC